VRVVPVVPVVLCVDVEPDARRIAVPGPTTWSGFERFVAGAPELRARLAEASGRPARLSWFLRMDPQIEVAYGSACWAADRYRAELAELAGAGDELGIHAHNWRWDGEEWISDQGDPAWVAQCTSTSLRAYEASFGRPCPSYRGGDRYFDAAVFGQLRDHGVAVDLSVEPGVPEVPGLVPVERSTGRIPGVPVGLDRPYVPAADDPLVPSSALDDLLVIPLTSSTSFQDGDPAAASPPVATLTLWSPPRLFSAAFERRMEDEPSHLAFAVRSDVGLGGTAWPWFQQNVRLVADRLGATAQWCTPTEAAALLRSRAACPAEGRPSPAANGADDAVEAGKRLEAAVRDAETALLEGERARRALEDEVSRQATSLAEVAAVAEERLAVLDGLAVELARLQAEVADYAEEAGVLRRAAADGAAAERLLGEVLATRWWRLHGVLERAAASLRTRSRRPR
jgi:hypothetical protein